MKDNKKNTILLVEDEAIQAMTIKTTLEKYGYFVINVNSGATAIALLKKNTEIELILMDIDLGEGIDGIETVKQILKKKDIPVVFLSSHSEPEIVEKTEQITSYGFVIKNSPVSVLIASIKMAFKLFEEKKKTQAITSKLEATLAALPDLMFEFDLDGNCFDYHTPHTQLIYSRSADIIGKNVFDILPAESGEIVMASLKEAHEKGLSVGKQFEMDVAAGNLWFEISASRKEQIPDEPHFIILAHNITGRKRIEEDLRIHQIELKMQNEELRRTQGELEAASARYFDLYDLAPVGYITVNETDVIQEANLAAAALFGMARDSIVSVPIFHFIYKDDQNIYYLLHKRLFETGEKQLCNLRIVKNNGIVSWVHLVASVAKKENSSFLWRFVLNDITDAKLAEDALRETEEKYRTIIEQATDGITLTDSNGNISIWNKAMGTITGINESEAIGRPVWEVQGKMNPEIKISAELLEQVQNSLNDILESKIVSSDISKEHLIQCPDGSHKVIQDSTFIIQRNNGINLGSIVKDITEKKFAEEKIKSLLEEKDIILKEVHHRIKNNMNSIYGMLVLHAGKLSEPSAISALEDAGSRVQSMLLLYEKLYKTAAYEEISVMEYLPSLIDEVISSFPNANAVKVEKHVEDFVLNVKKIQPLGIIVNELLCNIMKYAFTGKNDGFISVSVQLRDNRVFIEITDNGNGLPGSVNFENSTGFGLVLVSSMLKQLEGSIRAERVNGTQILLEFDRG